MAWVGSAGGASLHAASCVPSNRRGRLERLCRYVARPPLATERPSLDRRLGWAERMKRTFEVDVLRCECGGGRRGVVRVLERGVVVRILRRPGLAWEAPVTEPSRAPPVLEFGAWSEVVGETAAPEGWPHGPVRASGRTGRSGGRAEGDFGGPQAVATAVGRGSESGRPACCGRQ